MVGLSTTITSMIGFDCSVHMCKYWQPRHISVDVILIKIGNEQRKKSRMPQKRYRKL
jgi:hypothetical protein